jgi:NAD(P)H dehydrogenase (quinone)
LTGREISYHEVSQEDYARWLVDVGFPEPFARFLASIESAIAQDELYDESHQLSQLLGRPTTSWRQVVAEILRGEN